MAQGVRKRVQAGKGKAQSGDEKSSRLGHSNSYGVVTGVTLIVTVCGLLYIYLSRQGPEVVRLRFEGPEVVFVSVTETVQRAVFEVPCSGDYKNEDFHECKPKRCVRVVMDNLVTQEDANYLLRVAQKGLALGGSSGGASILDLHSGALSKDNAFIDIYRLLKTENIKLLTEEDFQIYKKVKNQIHDTIAAEFEIPPDKLYLTKPTFFSRMNMTAPKTIHDEYWHAHVDKETYGSFHYTSLLYLATYKQDFDGGRFVFVDKDVNRTVEPKLGRVSFFTSGQENVHFVERLKDGIRYAITVSFTCDPSKAISDPETR